MARSSKGFADGVAAICFFIGLILGLAAIINFFQPSQPTCDGKTMQPGDTCIVTQNGQSHTDTYEDRLQLAQSSSRNGVVFLRGALGIVAAGFIIRAVSNRPGAARAPQDTEEALLKTAESLQAEKRLWDALHTYERATQLYPTSVRAWVGKGDMSRTRGRLEDALPAYERAIQLDPNSATAWEGKGNALLLLGKPVDEALAAFERAIQLDPTSASPLIRKGSVLKSRQRYQEALAAYDQAIQVDPTNVSPWWSKHSLFLEWGKRAEAEQAFATAQALKDQALKAQQQA
jgi:tetratricopeptide (TPR) repeat protein